MQYLSINIKHHKATIYDYETIVGILYYDSPIPRTDGDDRREYRFMRKIDSDGEYFVGHWMNQKTFQVRKVIA